ncbi:hypothetical protein DdX_21590 [Ditylenchus destructor]|uniref:Uncharacterized protein n=1 Tax=Ditylenchus destructor TaxID=166010 RepID=A0AAD4MG86_9BILA|nr:hypothetical protein DdX_21590 [Ditylenchus destructor]
MWTTNDDSALARIIKDVAYKQYCANARKPIIDKIERLESKLDQCRKPDAEILADLERRRMRYGIAKIVTVSLVLVVLLTGAVAIIALLIGYPTDWEKLLSIVSGIGLTVVLPLLILTLMKLEGVYDELEVKASRYKTENIYSN